MKKYIRFFDENIDTKKIYEKDFILGEIKNLKIDGDILTIANHFNKEWYGRGNKYNVSELSSILNSLSQFKPIKAPPILYRGIQIYLEDFVESLNVEYNSLRKKFGREIDIAKQFYSVDNILSALECNEKDLKNSIIKYASGYKSWSSDKLEAKYYSGQSSIGTISILFIYKKPLISDIFLHFKNFNEYLKENSIRPAMYDDEYICNYTGNKIIDIKVSKFSFNMPIPVLQVIIGA